MNNQSWEIRIRNSRISNLYTRKSFVQKQEKALYK